MHNDNMLVTAVAAHVMCVTVNGH